jgi:hypothetical protein
LIIIGMVDVGATETEFDGALSSFFFFFFPILKRGTNGLGTVGSQGGAAVGVLSKGDLCLQLFLHWDRFLFFFISFDL